MKTPKYYLYLADIKKINFIVPMPRQVAFLIILIQKLISFWSPILTVDYLINKNIHGKDINKEDSWY